MFNFMDQHRKNIYENKYSVNIDKIVTGCLFISGTWCYSWVVLDLGGGSGQQSHLPLGVLPSSQETGIPLQQCITKIGIN